MREALIELTDISKSFSVEPILNSLNLTVEKGDFISIRGKSGVGARANVKPKRKDLYHYTIT